MSITRSTTRILVVALVAALAVPVVALAARQKPGTYVGKTKDGKQAAVIVDGQRRFQGIQIKGRPHCDKPGKFGGVHLRGTFPRPKIRHGRFTFGYRLHGRFSITSHGKRHVYRGGHARFHFTGHFIKHGRVVRGRAVGVFTARHGKIRCTRRTTYRATHQ